MPIEMKNSSTIYQAKYFANELSRQAASDSLEKFGAVLSNAQVDLNPHQVEAALFAFRSPLSKGAILADEVGLGKTIEAAIVIAQKWAEKKRKILVVTPANLRKQWNLELAEKFFLPSTILESKLLKDQIKAGNVNPFDQKGENIVICSHQFVHKQAHYIKLINWDLVVIDEAHRLRNVHTGGKVAVAIKDAVAAAPKILLTATPLQNNLLELYGLSLYVDEHLFGDKSSFKAQFSKLKNDDDLTQLKERLSSICSRTLRRQVTEYIKYPNRVAITQEFFPTDEETELYDLVSEYLQRADLYALPNSQRKLMTMILRKLLASSTHAISGTLETLQNRLQGIVDKSDAAKVEAELEAIGQDFEEYDEMAEEWEDDEDEAEAQKPEKSYSVEEIGGIRAEVADLKRFHELALSIKKNSKGESLMTALDVGLTRVKANKANRKALIFTESRRTQDYLFNLLENSQHKGKVLLFNGSNTDPLSKSIYDTWLKKYKNSEKFTGSKTADMRTALVEHFRNEADIMIATEAAAEGINLQFCSLIVNYDLPWNPQRIEQRIGRCHRYGQQFEVVVINFLNKGNAADQRVYELLKEKFKLFDGVFGASDEVLGAISSGLDFEKRVLAIYQTCKTNEQIQFNFDDLQRQMEEEIRDRMADTQEKLLTNFDESVAERLKLNLINSNEMISKNEDMLWKLTGFALRAEADFDQENHAFVLKANPLTDQSIPLGHYALRKNGSDGYIYRQGHPLAQSLIETYRDVAIKPGKIIFDYSGYGKKISQMEPLIGKSGVLQVHKLTIASLQTEEVLFAVGMTNDGVAIESEALLRLLRCPAREEVMIGEIGRELSYQLKNFTEDQKNIILRNNEKKNAEYFSKEIDKLDAWSDDRKLALEHEIREIDLEIRETRKLSGAAFDLNSKLGHQKKLKELEALRTTKRKTLFDSQDEIDNKRNGIIAEIEARMQPKMDFSELFQCVWQIV